MDKPREISLQIEGPIAFHDQPCGVHPSEHAVYCLNSGIFRPSWKAREEGWQLVQAKTWLQKLLMRLAFSEGK